MWNKSKRRFVFAVMLLSILCIAGAISAYGANPVTLQLDGRQVSTDVAPVIEDGRVLIPARAVFEAAGGVVHWDKSAPTDISVEYGGSVVELKVNSTTAYVNGQAKTLDVPARLVNNRTIIPVRFVSESLNFSVRWNNKERVVSLYTPGNAPPLGNITGLSLAANGNKHRVTITADQNLSDYQQGSLTGPDRFYVDFTNFNISSSVSPVNSTEANCVVSTVRGGSVDGSSTPTARIVMDLQEASSPVVTLSADQKSLYLDFNRPSFDPMADGKLVVMLDPGHGASTGGKRSPDGSLLEYEFNRDVANRIKPILEAAGIEVLFTVSTDEDTSLQRRCEIANQSNADIFVSVHANAFGNGWTAAKGWEIYVYKKGGVAEVLAKSIQAASNASLGLVDRGLKEADFYVIKYTDVPAVLIEHGFYTNAEEVELLKSPEFRQKLAQADADGIINFLKAYR